MFEQASDIRWYKRFVDFSRAHEWALAAGRLLGHHRLLSRHEFFQAAVKLCGVRAGDLESYRSSLASNELLRERYIWAVDTGRIKRKYKRYEDRFNNIANVVVFYALIRDLKPKVVVETGTATGSMTSWILAALEANGSGQLISIDLPARKGELTMDITVEDTGLLIPSSLRHRWTLIFGDATNHLPNVLRDHDADVFFHDSLHTRTHQLFEYNTARRKMRPNTVIISDDILWNGAWFDFTKSHRLPSIGCIDNPNLGLTVNQIEPFEISNGHGTVGTRYAHESGHVSA